MATDHAENGEGERHSFLRAIGSAVVGAAALESGLKLQLAAFTEESWSLADYSAVAVYEAHRERLDRLTAGQLLGELRKRGYPPELLERIENAIKRRNQLVHGMLQDAEITQAATSGSGLDQAIARIERLGRDCFDLAEELYTVTIRILEEVTGLSAAALSDIFRHADPSIIDDPADRAWVEAEQAKGGFYL